MVEDKDTKNRFATENVYNSIKHEKTVSIIERNQVEGYIKVAAPLGVLAGIVPTTNPTSTTMFKILVALKTRNAIIFSSTRRPRSVQSMLPRSCMTLL